MDKTFTHIALKEESADRIRQAIREADLDALRNDPYYAMPDDPGLADIGEPQMAGRTEEPKVTDIGDLVRKPDSTETGRAAGGTGRSLTTVLRFLPLVAAAAILLMIAVPRILPNHPGETGEISTIEKPDDGGAYMEGGQTPTVTSPLIVARTLTAETAAASLQAFYGEAYLVEVTSETGDEAVLAISREGEETVTAVISLEDGAVAIRSAAGELLSEGVIASDGTYQEKE